MWLMFTGDLKWLVCWSCVVLICHNKRRQNHFACEVANFYATILKGITVWTNFDF